HGIDEVDQWDRRSEEEIEADREMKRKMKELQKQGKGSDDSFEGGKYGKNKDETDNGTVHVTDINSSQNEDGSISIDNIRAVKTGGEIDEDLREANKRSFEEKVQAALKGKPKFTPEDFANVL